MAQNMFPDDTALSIDSLLEKAYTFQQKKDSVNTNRMVKAVDTKLGALQQDYSSYRGLISLFQSFYHFNPAERNNYRRKGLTLLKGSSAAIADSFAAAFYNLSQLFYTNKRMEEWMPADSLFRMAIVNNEKLVSPQYIIINYVEQKLTNKEYFIAKQLALYDYYVLLSRRSKDPLDKLCLMFDDWLVLKADWQQLSELTYTQRFRGEYAQPVSGGVNFITEQEASLHDELRSVDYKTSFKTLLSRVKELKKEMVLDNTYGSQHFNPSLRTGYYNIYSAIIHGFYEWAISEHKEGQVILLMKEFIFSDLLPNEMEAAVKAGVRPAVNTADYITQVHQLATLYERMGNGTEAKTSSYLGMEVLVSSNLFSSAEVSNAIITSRKDLVIADRLLNNFTASLASSQLLKTYTPLPPNGNKEQLPRWENYIAARTEEIYTLLAAQQYNHARDSLKKLIADVQTLDDNTNDALLYNTKGWPHIAYLTAIVQAQDGKWLPELLGETIGDLQKNAADAEIFYPAQLVYLKASFRTNKEIPTTILSNLLFYTGRQLRYTFMMLDAPDRMRLYEQKLSVFFDVYHELLFTKKLDAYPALKEKVIAQSLSLKKTLADGNLIPDELLVTSKDSLSMRIVEAMRSLRQETNLYLQDTRLQYNLPLKATALNDQMQTHWLNQLEKAGMDSLVQLTDWRTIAAALQPAQVYTETIRYNKWLEDSSAVYGSFIILPNKQLEVLNLYSENKLIALLKDAASSPQTAALGQNSNRGLIIKDKDSSTAKFKQGNEDQLGLFLLQPFWPYVQNKKEWLMVQDGLLNRISFAALQWKKQYLFNYFLLQQLSGSYTLLLKNKSIPKKGRVLLAGGLLYGNTSTPNKNRVFIDKNNWPFLPGTKLEVEKLQTILSGAGYSTKVFAQDQFSDSLSKSLSAYQFIHIASHGFYLDSVAAKKEYSGRWNAEAVQYEPLFRCGIALSGANDPDTVNQKNKGYLMGYELANMDLRNCYLISLSACETGLGDVRNNLGVDGLSRALKLSGARHLLISLWKVPDKPTALFMELFYKEIVAGKQPSLALQSTQLLMSKNYPATDWGAFVLVE